MISKLEALGLGVSLSLASQPDPVALVQSRGGPQFVEYAGLADVSRVLTQVKAIQGAGGRILFHPSYINFCGSFANSPRWLDATAQHIQSVHSPWFAQDCAYCFWNDDFGYSTQLGYFVPPLFNRASLEKAIERICEVKARMPVPVAIEPPPVLFVAGGIPLFSFFGELAERSDCAILLDMGHLVSWEMATGNKVLDAINDLPVQRVIEVHIAGGKLQQGPAGPMYVDAHECPVLPEAWQMLEDLLPYLPNIKAVCFECEGTNAETVMKTLVHLRQITLKKSVSQTLLNKVTAA